MSDTPPGIYLVNASGEFTALAVEDGSGDHALLREALDEADVPEAEYVFTDTYECDRCDLDPVEVSDYLHRTRIGYTAASIRCQSCDKPLTRVD